MLGRPSLIMKFTIEHRSHKERFLSNTSRHNDCILYMGSVNSSGYCNLRVDGSRLVSAHRYSWEIHNGNIPDGLMILHKCDVRRCINPDHLFLGTSEDNIFDMIAKGRSLRGERNPNIKLTKNEVMLCKSIPDGIGNKKKIADYLGVGQSLITKILNGSLWGHVGDPTNEHHEEARTILGIK